jgi:hypothetical protein
MKSPFISRDTLDAERHAHEVTKKAHAEELQALQQSHTEVLSQKDKSISSLQAKITWLEAEKKLQELELHRYKSRSPNQ